MENTDSKNILLSVIGVAILFVAVVGITYAIFVFTGNGNKKNTISTGTISILYTESSNVISINNAMPMSDSVGKIQNEYFDFSVSAKIKGKASINYEVRARRTDKTDINRLPDNQVNIYLEKQDSNRYVPVMEPKTFIPTSTTLDNTYVNNDSMLLYKGTMTSNGDISVEDKYRLRIWLKENTEVYNSSMIYKLRVDVYSSLNK